MCEFSSFRLSPTLDLLCFYQKYRSLRRKYKNIQSHLPRGGSEFYPNVFHQTCIVLKCGICSNMIPTTTLGDSMTINM